MKKKVNKQGDFRGMSKYNPITRGLKGEKNGRWKGGVLVRIDGYIIVRRGSIPKSAKGARYTLLHRLLMEEKLGRKLLRSEIVHHIDGNNRNNSLDNLAVMTQAEHASLHMKDRKKTKGKIL